jgi:D-galactarolactone isomerase
VHEQTEKKPRLIAPAGTCDTHIHFYNTRFPTAATAKVTPPDASVAQYRDVCRRLGIQRCVVVQPTTYGRDNACTLEGMAEFGSSARGIAVLDENAAASELQALDKAGIRGVRFHMLAGGALNWESLLPTAKRIQDLGWHVQLQLDGRDLPQRQKLIESIPGILVLDHTGKFLEPVKIDDPAYRILRGLVDNGQTYVKLSAPYEVSKVGPPSYADVGDLAKDLVRAAPERMLWATNWPHPSAPAQHRPDDADMLDLLLDWAPNEAHRQKILVDNPARLYGF